MDTGRRRGCPDAEFTARISPDGGLLVPREVAGRLREFTGSVVAVRVSEESLSAALRARGIGDEEVGRVAAVQLESREKAARFLLAEGIMRGRERRKVRR